MREIDLINVAFADVVLDLSVGCVVLFFGDGGLEVGGMVWDVGGSWESDVGLPVVVGLEVDLGDLEVVECGLGDVVQLVGQVVAEVADQ